MDKSTARIIFSGVHPKIPTSGRPQPFDSKTLDNGVPMAFTLLECATWRGKSLTE